MNFSPACDAEENRVLSMTNTLTPIWQRVLRRSAVGLEDNFFDLGGDPTLADQLFAEIRSVCGREIPASAILEAPTIATLAALLEREPRIRLSPRILLKPGEASPPVFMAHGLGGTVMEVVQLAQHIRSPHPIYGIQARGLDGIDSPLEHIEDMAQFHLDAIRELQPHGPYFLVGYSLGGLVMFEAAQRLVGRGERVALLAMLDAYLHASYLSPAQRALLLLQRARRRLSTLIRGRKNDAPLIVYSSKPGLRSAEVESASAQPLTGSSSVAFAQQMRQAGYSALACYRPRLYPGEIRFVRAATASVFPEDPAAVWGKLAHQFNLETTPGDHVGIVTTYTESLASIVSRYLEEAASEVQAVQ